MQVPVVNKDDEIIGLKDWSGLSYATDIFRTASLWITNSRDEVLLARRKWDKKIDPGKWAEAVGGTVEGDDSYEQTVLREATEELGLEGISVAIGPKQFIDDSAKYFVQWYTATVDLPVEDFVIQADEVEAIAWIPFNQLQRELIEAPDSYIPAMKEIVKLFA